MFISRICRRWSSEVSARRWISSRTPTSWIDSTFSLCNSFRNLSYHLASLTLCMHLQKIADMKKLFREHEEQLERVKKSSKMVKESNIPKCQLFFTVFPTFRAVCICMQDSHHGSLDGSVDGCKTATQPFRHGSVICEKSAWNQKVHISVLKILLFSG